MTYYKTIKDFARGQGIDTTEKGKEIVFKYCPYCHGGTHKDKKTFSINRDTGQYECKRSSCNARGNIKTLSDYFSFNLPEEYKANYKQEEKPIKYDIPDQKIEQPNEYAYKYFNKRGISKSIVDKYRITTLKGKTNILDIPFIDDKGTVILRKCRKTDFKKSVDKQKEWYSKNNNNEEIKNILFGMYQCDTSNDTLIITEGQIDCLSVAECGFNNVVSVPNGAKGFKWLEHCLEWLLQFKKLLVFGDYENEHITLIKELKEQLEGKFKGVIFNIKPEYYKDCKDANEILTRYGKDAIKKAIENKTPSFPHDCIVNISDIKITKYTEEDFLKTQIKELDLLLGGGLLKGGVSSLSGDTGCGKSTFTSQIVANMIDQNIKTLIYSGEMQKDAYIKTLFNQWASKKNIETDKRGNYLKNYVKEPIEEKIREWTNNRAFMIDNERNISKLEPELTIDLIRTGILQEGCEFVVVDNLMTAMQGNYGNDLLAEQSKFVIELANLSRELNIVILLIAHHKKYAMSGNDAISGSKEIANISSVVMHYDKPDPDNLDAKQQQAINLYKDNSMRLLSVSKNRNGGSITEKGKEIILLYEKESKRIEQINRINNEFIPLEKTDLFNRKYNWEREE